MILIADCGSTKTDWVLYDGTEIVSRIKTQGLNPTQQSSEQILDILSKELKDNIDVDAPKKIYFYGAGCAYENANARMRTALELIFNTKEIEIKSDLLAAARAMCGPNFLSWLKIIYYLCSDFKVESAAKDTKICRE